MLFWSIHPVVSDKTNENNFSVHCEKDFALQFLTDPFEALKPGSACIQHPLVIQNRYSQVGRVEGPTSEDCLFLNMWISRKAGTLKPVLVRKNRF